MSNNMLLHTPLGAMEEIRNLPSSEAEALAPGSYHYTAYVGPPEQWDLMGASQFRLLSTLGLRAHHRLLDLGCGSLRAGRFLINYLAKGNYFGIDPNQWLIKDAIARELGSEILTLKAPHFSYNSDFSTDVFGKTFHYILAQSIFSHAGPDLTRVALKNIACSLTPNGLAAVTFIHPEQAPSCATEKPGWHYPDCITYAPATISKILEDSGLIGRPIPWHHPRQTWYLISRNEESMIPSSLDAHLSGLILREPEP